MRTVEHIDQAVQVAEELPKAHANVVTGKTLVAGRRLWVSALAHEWKVLALVPAEPGVSLRDTARALEQVASREGGEALLRVDGAGASLKTATALVEGLRAHLETGGRGVVVVDAPADEPAAVPLALCADAVVIGVRLGKTTVEDVERTRAAVGNAKVIGSVLVEEAE